MEISDIIAYTIAAGVAFGLWRLLVVGFRKSWNQPTEIKDVNWEHFGKRTNINGLQMYGGDPELVTRVEKELIRKAKDN